MLMSNRYKTKQVPCISGLCFHTTWDAQALYRGKVHGEFTKQGRPGRLMSADEKTASLTIAWLFRQKSPNSWENSASAFREIHQIPRKHEVLVKKCVLNLGHSLFHGDSSE